MSPKAWIAFAVLIAGFALWLYVSQLQGDLKAATNRADTAERQAQLATNTIQITERFHTTERVVSAKAEEQADAVQAIPSDELPSDVRGLWVSGLRNVHAAAGLDHGSTNAP